MTFEIGRIILLPYGVHMLNGPLNTNKQKKKTLKKTKKRKMKDTLIKGINTTNGAAKIE